MFGIFRLGKCNHEYKKSPTITSERDGFDNLVVTRTHYECVHCNDRFTVVESVKREKDYYFDLGKVARCLRECNENNKKKRRVTKESLKNIKPLKLDKE